MTEKIRNMNENVKVKATRGVFQYPRIETVATVQSKPVTS
jgi:hypothetical protein